MSKHKKLQRAGYRFALLPEHNYGVSNQWHYREGAYHEDYNKEIYKVEPLYTWVEIECHNDCHYHTVFLEGDIIE